MPSLRKVGTVKSVSFKTSTT